MTILRFSYPPPLSLYLTMTSWASIHQHRHILQLYNITADLIVFFSLEWLTGWWEYSIFNAFYFPFSCSVFRLVVYSVFYCSGVADKDWHEKSDSYRAVYCDESVAWKMEFRNLGIRTWFLSNNFDDNLQRNDRQAVFCVCKAVCSVVKQLY